MSEAVQEAVPTPADVAQGDPVDLGEAGKKALDAERKRANALEKQLKQFQTEHERAEAAKLSDLERAQREAATAREEAAQAAADALRWRIAAKHGVSDEDAELFLTGGDAETLTRQAERLSARATAPTNPRPDPSQGAKAALPLNGDALENALRSKLGI